MGSCAGFSLMPSPLLMHLSPETLCLCPAPRGLGRLLQAPSCRGAHCRTGLGLWGEEQGFGGPGRTPSILPNSAQTFHQDSQAGAQAWAPQSLLSCRSQEENSFQLNYPSHSNIITLQ